MKAAIKIIIAIILVAAIGFGGFIGFQCSKGISYDIASVEKLQSDIEIVSETDDSVTIKKKSDGDFKVLMFTDTHLKGDKELDNMTVTYLVEMLMYGKEASNRKQEIDRQHYTIPNQRPKDKHCGKI